VSGVTWLDGVPVKSRPPATATQTCAVPLATNSTPARLVSRPNDYTMSERTVFEFCTSV